MLRVIDTSQIYLYGFSQACALNFRFASLSEVAAGVIGVCGGVPGDLETKPLYKQFAARIFIYTATMTSSILRKNSRTMRNECASGCRFHIEAIPGKARDHSE